PISYPQKRTLHQEGLPGITGQKRQKRSNGDTLHRKLSNQDTSPEAAIQCLNLSALPAELIGMIFDELNIIDALCLTVSAQRFWEIGWPYMEKKLMGFMGPWAGHRLVCVGEDPIEDYPPDMLNKDEKEELAKGLDADEYADDEYGKLHAGSPIDLSLLVNSSRYYEAESFVPPFRLVQILDKFAIDQMRNMPRQMRSRVFKFSSFRHCSEFFPDDQKWVLRNLTTHEFVRFEALAGNSSQTGRHMKDLGFEHLILSRTFWSSSPSSAKLFKSRSLHRGIWAGHRLEITLLDRHTKSMRSDVAWKDISEDAVEDMIQLMRDADGWLNNKQFKSLDERFNGRLSSQS
ncbi:hypothetical protein MMC31_003857, partial [Peltigera leucophlebia]|nr:hypothetical protein [Peltigera leucophlebia]